MAVSFTPRSDTAANFISALLPQSCLDSGQEAGMQKVKIDCGYTMRLKQAFSHPPTAQDVRSTAQGFCILLMSHADLAARFLQVECRF